jgi:hypothetical protein
VTRGILGPTSGSDILDRNLHLQFARRTAATLSREEAASAPAPQLEKPVVERLWAMAAAPPGADLEVDALGGAVVSVEREEERQQLGNVLGALPVNDVEIAGAPR